MYDGPKKPEPNPEPKPSIAYRVWFDELKFCGCGSPETVLRHLRDSMRAIKVRIDFWHSKPGITATMIMSPESAAMDQQVRTTLSGDSDKPGVLYYLTGYLLDAAGLTEHGSLIPGWLTPKGDELLAFLDATPEDDWLKRPWERN